MIFVATIFLVYNLPETKSYDTHRSDPVIPMPNLLVWREKRRQEEMEPLAEEPFVDDYLELRGCCKLVQWWYEWWVNTLIKIAVVNVSQWLLNDGLMMIIECLVNDWFMLPKDCDRWWFLLQNADQEKQSNRADQVTTFSSFSLYSCHLIRGDWFMVVDDSSKNTLVHLESMKAWLDTGADLPYQLQRLLGPHEACCSVMQKAPSAVDAAVSRKFRLGCRNLQTTCILYLVPRPLSNWLFEEKQHWY